MAFHLNAKVVCMDTVYTLVKVRCFYDLVCKTLIFGMPRANLWFTGQLHFTLNHGAAVHRRQLISGFSSSTY